MIVLCVLAACSGCASPAASAVSSVSQADEQGYCSCVYQGVTRKFILRLPEQSADGAPLLFLLHGYGQTASGFAQNTHMHDSAAQYGYAVVYPQAMHDPADQTAAPSWNSGLKDSGNDDVGFLAALARYLQDTYGFSPEATFAAGFSNGAFMTYRLAAKAPDTFRAVASVAGFMPVGAWAERSETASVGILQINGTKDDLVTSAHGNAPDIDQVIEYWRTANGLDTHQEVSLSEQATVQCYSAAGSDSLVWHVVIEGGRHAWPEERFAGFDVNELLLDYFNRYL